MGLRGVVALVLGIGIAGALVLAFTRYPCPWFVLAGYWALGLLAIAIERGRYRPKLIGTNFQPTTERYADPVSGETISVYVDAATGQRDYRRDPPPRGLKTDGAP